MDSSGSPTSNESTSPLGVSRYGRARKPKISSDFCHIDDALIDEEVSKKSPEKFPQNQSPVKTPKKHVKSPTLEISEDIKTEGLRALNDAFERTRIDDVLKIFGTTNLSDLNSPLAKKPSPVRTYVNKRKLANSLSSPVIESFGLPDEPIVPICREKAVFKTFKGLDLDESSSSVRNFTIMNDCEDVDIDDTVFKENGMSRPINPRSYFKARKSDPIEYKNCKSDCVSYRSKSKEELNTMNDKVDDGNEIIVKIKENFNKIGVKVKNRNGIVNMNPVSSVNTVTENNNVKKTLIPHIISTDKKDETKEIVKEISLDDKFDTEEKQNKMDMNDDCIIDNEIELRNSTDKPINNGEADLIEDHSIDTNKLLEKKEVQIAHPGNIDSTNESIINPLEFEMSAGKLMWGKVGCFPYWPCMITEDPESKQFTKSHKRKTVRQLCHVRFFGDQGRRAWITTRNLVPYGTFEELRNFAKTHLNTIVNMPLRSAVYTSKWYAAIEEANFSKDKLLEDKMEFFETVLKEQNEIRKHKVRKPKENHKRKRIEEKQEPDENSETETCKRLTRNSLDSSKSDLSPKRKKEDDSESENLETEREFGSEHFPTNMNDQIALYKRNNLFKKVAKERVCQVCLKFGNVLKCKGKCQGYYHTECSFVEPKKELDKSEVEIVTIKDTKRLTPTDLTLNCDDTFKNLSLVEQIDHKMNQVMDNFNEKSLYLDSTTDCSLDESYNESYNGVKVRKKVEKKNTEFICSNCSENVDPSCSVCRKSSSETRQKCSWPKCSKFYHQECLKSWPHTQWSLSSTKQSNEFVCPMHVCHTCVSDDPRSSALRSFSDRLARCVHCPSTYHSETRCIPAGTEILTATQIVCPKHAAPASAGRPRRPINTTWCFICSEGGTLVCCDTCPISVHAECLDIKFADDDDKFVCEDCETGRFPLYDEIVWVKLGNYRWWPAVILFPNEVPERVQAKKHGPGEFVVKFFGTYDHYWVSKARVFPFEEGDNGGVATATTKKRMEELFRRSIDEATTSYLLKKEFKESILQEAGGKSKHRPPPYVKIKVNRPVGNVRQFDGNMSNTTACECDPKEKNPCGPDSDCLNRLLLTECDPTVCPAGDDCQNQNFERRSYPDLVPYRTDGRGWGLRALEPLTKGQFVIEYVGEMIDELEYQRRVKRMHELKEENYYFLTIDKDRMIDAGPKGNLARFMNHSCQPNCETQKWTVNGDTRVGLFAMADVPANTELTFNYNLECIGKEKKICMCRAPNCSGFIGVKASRQQQEKIVKKQQQQQQREQQRRKGKKKRSPTPIVQELLEPCFVCGREGNLKGCDHKTCSNFYHTECVGLKNWSDGKWICPRHNCTICMKRTIRCCVKCLNSYCPKHSQGNIRHDRSLGFVCSTHDPRKRLPLPLPTSRTQENNVTLTTEDFFGDLPKRKRRNGRDSKRVNKRSKSNVDDSPRRTLRSAVVTVLDGSDNSLQVDVKL